MNIKKKIIALLSVTMLTFMVGCSSSESNESNVTNSNGEEVVVATSVAVTEILDKLGVEVPKEMELAKRSKAEQMEI